MNLRSLLCSLALSLSVPAAAFAQEPAPQGAARERVAPTPARASGAVARLLVGPGGHARGFALANGTVVFVGRGGDDLAARVRPGMNVQVEGFSRPMGGSTVIHRATVRAADGTVLVQAPAGPPPTMRPGDHDRAEGAEGRGRRGGRGGFGHGGRGGRMEARLGALPAHTSRGTVQSVVSGPRGAVRMLLLSDGSTAYLRPNLGHAVAQHGVRNGDAVTVEGRGNPSPAGVGVAAERVTFADGTTVTAPPVGARR